MLSCKTYGVTFDVGDFGFVLLLPLRPALLGSPAQGIGALVHNKILYIDWSITQRYQQRFSTC